MAAENDDSVVMTGGSFTTADVVAKQPAGSRSNGSQKIQWRRSVAKSAFDDTLIERDWVAPLFSCKDGKTSNKSLVCCWCYHKYMLAMRLGETPFLCFMPCSAFGLRVKVRTQFALKGSMVGDLFTSFFCEPCTVCQMTRELDHVGL
ncbi:cornifelin homolog B-like [Dreissena polymorpha]|uniref:Cornifelin n=1 Tax=Dreissena polymorpha TaxID=45954 RepID=A0A9D4JRL5_DREPO|nr:cornifelin homolog B-like [Dreissena polymorpha]XP_052211997.1 cornifelin homolog B-like [Dreissena polymorpha]KAH3821751.1 hypothetical protein DPMN_123518 [Dreissena polymorpha]